MRQKGKRFYVEDKNKTKSVKSETKKVPLKEPEVVEPESQDNAKTKAFEVVGLSKKELRKKQKVSKQIEKDRKKNLKANKKAEKPEKPVESSVEKTEVTQTDDVEKTSEKKILKFTGAYKDDNGKFSFKKLSKTIRLNKKSIVLSAVIILLLALTVLMFSNRDRLSFTSIKNWVEYGVLNINSEQHFPIATNGDVINSGNFSRIERNLVFASDTKFATLNNYGRTIYESPQAFSSPVMARSADSDLSLVYNLGGTSFSIYSLDSTFYAGEAEDNILVGDISKNGTYALVTEKDGYMSKLFVYSNENKQIFAYSFADYYITSVSLDSKGKSAVLSGMSAHDGIQYSAVYLLDFTKEEPVIFEEFENNILYYVDHLTNNYVCVIGERSSYTLNVMTKSFNENSYEGKTLTAFDVNTDTNTFALSLSRSGDGRKCDILVFSTSGSLKETISTELKITSLSTYKNRVAALSAGTIYLYSKDGKLLSETNAGLDPNAVVLYSTTDAYVLGVSEIRRLDL